MRASRTLVAIAVAAVGLGSAPVAGDQAQTTFHAGLNGQREQPNPADRDGSGFARVTVDTVTGQICYQVTVRNIAPATAAHIHVGERDDAGPVVQGLQPPTDGSSSGCVTNAALAADLAANPSGYYVNVHNAEFTTGAVRGQLAGQRH